MKRLTLAELAERYQTWGTEELIRAATVERASYQTEALVLIERELQQRNVPTAEQDAIRDRLQTEELQQERKLCGVRGVLLLFVIVVLLTPSST